jgi:hypothetical protein
MRLDDPELSTASRGAPQPMRRSSRPPSSSSGGDYDASSQVSGLIENTQPVAELSPWLHKMLSDCDRRMFPAAPPLDLRFPAGDDGPLELVPRGRCWTCWACPSIPLRTTASTGTPSRASALGGAVAARPSVTASGRGSSRA